MRRIRTSALLLTVAGLIAMLAVPAVSSAYHNHRADTKIRVTLREKPFLQGVLSSKRDSCERGREVVVKRARPGHNKVVNVDISSYNGGWSADVNRRGVYIISIDGYGDCGGDKRRVAVPRT